MMQASSCTKRIEFVLNAASPSLIRIEALESAAPGLLASFDIVRNSYMKRAKIAVFRFFFRKKNNNKKSVVLIDFKHLEISFK